MLPHYRLCGPLPILTVGSGAKRFVPGQRRHVARQGAAQDVRHRWRQQLLLVVGGAHARRLLLRCWGVEVVCADLALVAFRTRISACRDEAARTALPIFVLGPVVAADCTSLANAACYSGRILPAAQRSIRSSGQDCVREYPHRVLHVSQHHMAWCDRLAR